MNEENIIVKYGYSDEDFRDSIWDWKEAYEHLHEMECEINQVVGPIITEAPITQEGIDDLQELVDMLPIGYAGVRRVYEKIHRIDEVLRPEV